MKSKLPRFHTQAMALTRERMMERTMAGDAAYNGRFIVGVKSTGIYCLPGCRAKRPKPENIRFFRNSVEARAAGLRPCKICRPDEYECGHDSDLERLETVARAVQASPGKFETVEEMADAACISASTLHQQFRDHFQLSPGTFLVRAKIDCASKLLREGKEDPSSVGPKVGFDSLSGFYESFRKQTGMTRAGYANLKSKIEFEISLPDRFPLAETLRVLARDPSSASERLDDSTYTVAYENQESPQSLSLNWRQGQVRCRLQGDDGFLAHETAMRIINLRQDPSGFERQTSEAGFERLFAGREGMRIPQTTNFFEGLVWVILGQQVNFRFAALMRQRLTEAIGLRAGELHCVPSPKRVAQMDESDLLRMQFSHQKAEYLLGVSRAIVNGELDVNKMTAKSATSVEKELRAVRGLGVWSVNYLMMRSLGFQNCLPLGDTGISSGLRNFLQLDHRPQQSECVNLMRPFAPYRSLACYHLWRGW